jgi:hypothetical protein
MDHNFGFATIQESLQENLDSVAGSGDMELKESNKDTWTEEAVPQRGWQCSGGSTGSSSRRSSRVSKEVDNRGSPECHPLRKTPSTEG